MGLPVDVIGGVVRPHLEDLAVPLDGVAHLDRLLDRERHGLLAIDVLPRVHRVDRHFRVPMVGRGDDHGVDVLPVQQLSVIEVSLAAADLLGRRETALVDVADADHLDVLRLGALDERPQVAAPHAAHADEGHPDALVGAPRPCRGRRPERGHRRRGGEELPSIELRACEAIQSDALITLDFRTF
jgi:hypothetical protein